MAMLGEDIERVRDSYRRLQPVSDAVGRHFYETLFALAPGARALFATDIDTQSRKLMDMIDAVVRQLDQPEKWLAACRELGARHAEYGAREEHYDAVGTALLQSLRAALGEVFTPAVEAAWAQVYGEMAEIMIAAAEYTDETQDASAPPTPH
jgi:hemoglobin-like flavoprotein